MLREWFWMFGFFPAWGLMAVVLFALAEFASRIGRIRLPAIFAPVFVFGSLGLAIGALVWVDCWLFMELPFTNPTCRLLGF